jgi:hypothetical protein
MAPRPVAGDLPGPKARLAFRIATVNIVFMDHFQRLAHAHFTLRRLERTYGSSHIRERYAELALVE